MAHVIVTGNPIDGFQLFGPFTEQAEADKFVEQEADGIELWVLPVHDPVMLLGTKGEG
jgi:hypothetical protein